jgi:hypothetical protein
VPDSARWDFIKERATSIEPTIGQLLDEAMLLLEAENASLKGVLTKNYARPELDQIRLGEVKAVLGSRLSGRAPWRGRTRPDGKRSTGEVGGMD